MDTKKPASTPAFFVAALSHQHLRHLGESRDPQPQAGNGRAVIDHNASSIDHAVWVPASAGTTQSGRTRLLPHSLATVASAALNTIIIPGKRAKRARPGTRNHKRQLLREVSASVPHRSIARYGSRRSPGRRNLGERAYFPHSLASVVSAQPSTPASSRASEQSERDPDP